MGKTKFIITETRPVLTPEERAKRMKEIEKAARDLLLAELRLEARKEREKALKTAAQEPIERE